MARSVLASGSKEKEEKNKWCDDFCFLISDRCTNYLLTLYHASWRYLLLSLRNLSGHAWMLHIINLRSGKCTYAIFYGILETEGTTTPFCEGFAFAFSFKTASTFKETKGKCHNISVWKATSLEIFSRNAAFSLKKACHLCEKHGSPKSSWPLSLFYVMTICELVVKHVKIQVKFKSENDYCNNNFWVITENISSTCLKLH